MKSLYEQKWKKAVEGAKIEPSEALWNNIASCLDKERGRNYWVTILMIAATVTIAFSFPLTIGDSAFETRQDIQEYTQFEKNNDSHLNPNLDSGENDLTINSLPFAKNESTKLAHIKDEQTLVDHIGNSDNLLEDTNMPVMYKKASGYQSAVVQGTGFTSLNWESSYKMMQANDYYFIPFYMPINKSEDRNLLASLNMGTGNSSNGNGLLSNFNKASESALSFLDANDALNDPKILKEKKGTTFYIGTGVEFPIGKRLSLLAGIGYLAQNTQGSNNIVLDIDNQYQPISVLYPFDVRSVYLSNSYDYTTTNNYISIPVSVKYPFIKRKIIFRAGAGVSTDFMLSHSVNSETYGKALYKPNEVDYYPVVFTGLVNLDVSYSLSNQYSIALETGFRKGITPIDKRKEVYPSSFTVGLVLFYKIR